MTPTSLPPAVSRAVDRWLDHHDSRAAGLVEGLYLVGSVALGDWTPASDIDVIAFTPDGLTEAEIEALRSANDAVDADPELPDVDGPYLRWGDVTRAPVPLLRPWTLHRELHHDDGCFELNPVMWHTLARHGVAVRGAVPAALSVHTDDVALRSFVVDNTRGYWRSVAAGVSAALEDPAPTRFPAEIHTWCVLGAARMLVTASTGRILSKAEAGRWLVGKVPAHRAVVEQALAIREGGGSGTVERSAFETLERYLADIIARVDDVGPAAVGTAPGQGPLSP